MISLPCGYVCRPPPCHNQRLLGRGPGVGAAPRPPPPPSLHLGDRSPRDFALDCVCITYGAGARVGEPGWSRWAYSWAQLESPVLGSNCVPCSTTEAGLELPESAFSICKAQSAVCLRARQGDHPEGRAGWSWADSDAHPQHRTPPTHPYASLSPPGPDSPGDESDLPRALDISFPELAKQEVKPFFGLFFFFFLATT